MLGYHITFHPYGTWLPGDRRGWTERRDGRPFQREPHPPREAFARELMKGAPVFLDATQRAVVQRTIGAVCSFHRWPLHAVVVHGDHIHAVITADVPPERVMNGLKAWSTRRMREANVAPPQNSIWARHGSTRYLDDEQRMTAAIEYVLRQGGVRRVDDIP